jgi:hypothetical protein
MPMTKEERMAALQKARAKRAENVAARNATKGDLKAARQMEQLVEAVDAQHDAVQRASTPKAEPVAKARTPMRSPKTGRSQAVGRNGEVLTRQRTQTGDIFEIPRNLIPEGWDYQWCAVSVTGNTEILLDQNLMMAENGWRPVPAERYPGRFMPVGHKGSIVRGGQMLMERPLVLSEEARADDIKAAHQLISDRNESLKLGSVKKDMASGFEMSRKYRGTGGDIRISIDREHDAPTPKYDLADPE